MPTTVVDTRTHVELSGGNWWRFTRYEVREGIIRPATGTRLQKYDPWAKGKPGKHNVESTPYRSLLTLVDHFSVPALVEWCQMHGLLGVLLHRAQTVTLEPQWKESRGVGRGRTEVSQDHFERSHVGWSGSRRTWSGPADRLREEVRPAGVLLQGLRRFESVPEPLSTTWERFFPGVSPKERSTYAYPMPISDQFWRRYGEPLDAFLDAAQALRDALRDTDTIDGKPRTERGLAALNALVAPIGPSIVREDGHFRQQWRCPSLLASFAMMALLDLTGERRVRACEVCGSTFVSAVSRARYCSVRCRRRAEQRVYRRRRRAKVRRASTRRSPDRTSGARN
jgi:hypothetical protein